MRLFLMLLVPSVALATPVQVNHQGRLLDLAGVPLNGERQLDIGIFADGSTVTAEWSELVTVTLQGGYYTAVLGADTAGNPLDDGVFDGSARYLGIAVVGSGDIGPRQLLASVPSAVHATSVSGGTVLVTDAQITGNLRLGSAAGTCSDGSSVGSIRFLGGLFEGCTAAGWNPIGATPWNCSDTPAHPGCLSSSVYPDCAAINDDPLFTGSSGEYYIDPDGDVATIAPYQVHCDMVTAGGGWTLAGIISSGDGIASATGCPSNIHWDYSDGNWTNTATLAPGVFTTTEDHKYASWSNVPYTDMLIEETVAGVLGYKAWAVGANSSLSGMFGGGCSTLASTPLASGGTISSDNAAIYTNVLKRNCTCDLVNNDDVCRLWGNSPTNPDGQLVNGGWGLGIDGDTGACSWDSEARPSRGGWTNQYYPSAVHYTGGHMWSSTHEDVGDFAARIYVR